MALSSKTCSRASLSTASIPDRIRKTYRNIDKELEVPSIKPTPVPDISDEDLLATRDAYRVYATAAMRGLIKREPHMAPAHIALVARELAREMIHEENNFMQAVLSQVPR